jgi:NADH-quinone oxidoreductase subunit M
VTWLAQGCLVAVLAIPIVTAGLLLIIPKNLVRWFALCVAVLVVCATAGLLLPKESDSPGKVIRPWHELDIPWIPGLDVRFHVGVDGLSWPLIALTSILVLCCTIWIVIKQYEVTNRQNLLLALVLVLETAMIGVFLALDVIVFFIFFELTLAPMYAVIAGWGSEKRLVAARKFVLYTLVGSVLLLIGVLWLVSEAGTSNIVKLADSTSYSHQIQLAIFIVLALAFAIKSPLWPLHTWLPDAHTEAPTVGSVLLAGVLLKLGSYGLLRIAVTLVPQGANTVAPYLAGFGVAAIIIGSLICLASDELKRLIAYSSVGHMGFVVLGIATLNEVGMQAAQLANIAHGLITGLLFFCVGMVKTRFGTGHLDSLGGLRFAVPRLAGIIGFAAIASFGLPGLAGFWGEAFAVVGAAQHNNAGWWLGAALAALGAAVVVVYFLRMLYLVITRQQLAPTAAPDVSLGELAALAPLVVAIVLIGLWPGVIAEITEEPVHLLVKAVTI